MPAKGKQWALVSGRFRQESQKHNAACWICAKPIDYSATPRTSESFSADHAMPTSLGGDPLAWNNLRPSHYGCNARRGNGTRGQFPTGRQW